jgi:hypothetical protein
MPRRVDLRNAIPVSFKLSKVDLTARAYVRALNKRSYRMNEAGAGQNNADCHQAGREGTQNFLKRVLGGDGHLVSSPKDNRQNQKRGGD